MEQVELHWRLKALETTVTTLLLQTNNAHTALEDLEELKASTEQQLGLTIQDHHLGVLGLLRTALAQG